MGDQARYHSNGLISFIHHADTRHGRLNAEERFFPATISSWLVQGRLRSRSILRLFSQSRKKRTRFLATFSAQIPPLFLFNWICGAPYPLHNDRISLVISSFNMPRYFSLVFFLALPLAILACAPHTPKREVSEDYGERSGMLINH